MSAPSTVVYFWLYDECKLKLEQVGFGNPPSTVSQPLSLLMSVPAPLVAGSTARTFTTAFVSPLELIRTRMQASVLRSQPCFQCDPATAAAMSKFTAPTASSVIKSELEKPGGIRNLWRGVVPTLWRDVPFSALYWTSYEFVKKTSMKQFQDLPPERRLLWSSFISGATSGMFAALCTHPFDLVSVVCFLPSSYLLHVSFSSSSLACRSKHEDKLICMQTN
jgi:solute carrier family 25 protein 39/40